VREIWKEGRVQKPNGMGADVDVKVFPRPVQESLPVWITVSGKEETFIDAGRIGTHILTHLLWQDTEELKHKIGLYRQSLVNHGHDPAKFKVSVMVHTHIGGSNEAVKSTVEKSLKDYIKSSVHLINAMTKSTKDEPNTRETVGRYHNHDGKVSDSLMTELLDLAFERFFENAALLGTPEKCSRIIEKLKDYGVNEVACLIDFGITNSEMMQGLRELALMSKNYFSFASYAPKIHFPGHSPEALEGCAGLPSVRKILVTASRLEQHAGYLHTNYKEGRVEYIKSSVHTPPQRDYNKLLTENF